MLERLSAASQEKRFFNKSLTTHSWLIRVDQMIRVSLFNDRRPQYLMKISVTIGDDGGGGGGGRGSESRDDALVTAFAGVDAICGLSLLLVLVAAPRVFLRVLQFSSLNKNQHSQIQILPGNSGEKSHSVEATEIILFKLKESAKVRHSNLCAFSET